VGVGVNVGDGVAVDVGAAVFVEIRVGVGGGLTTVLQAVSMKTIRSSNLFFISSSSHSNIQIFRHFNNFIIRYLE
jgi:hypothetical protein